MFLALLNCRNLVVTAACMFLVFAATGMAAVDDESVQTVIDLLNDKDKEMRALGLQQVREEIKGEAATKRFAALLPKLPADVQVELIGALADRGDKAARAALLESCNSQDSKVCVAAIKAIGSLAAPDDVAFVVKRLASESPDERAAAKKSLLRMCGEAISPAIAAELKEVKASLRPALVDILRERRASECVPAILPYVANEDQNTRAAAMKMLGAFAKPEHVVAMVAGVLKSEPGNERAAAEKAVISVCKRIKNKASQAEPVLAIWPSLAENDKTALTPMLGTLGGAAARKIVDAAIADARRHEAGIRALCNWPDVSVAPQLFDLLKSAKSPQQHRMILCGLARLATTMDERKPTERLEMLKKTMALANTAEERNYVIKRASVKPVRIIESLQFIVPYLDQPEYAQAACLTVVELAHHRELREPNKAEFHQVLKKVIKLSNDPDVTDRAQRYLKGQTRLLPTKPDEN